MPDRREFRAHTDQMLEIIDELRALEERKRAAEYGSPEFVELAAGATEHARLAFRWASMQEQMAHAAAADRVHDDNGHDQPRGRLKDVEPLPMDRILALWREAQFRLELAKPGSPEAAQAVSDIERLREEYQTVHATVAGRP